MPEKKDFVFYSILIFVRNLEILKPASEMAEPALSKTFDPPCEKSQKASPSTGPRRCKIYFVVPWLQMYDFEGVL
jgi:hypothetical protein